MEAGALIANQWIKAAWGWGLFAVDYVLTVSVPCDYNGYIGILPFPVSSGEAFPERENVITHRSVIYGDIWLRGRAAGSWALNPIGPSSPMQQRLHFGRSRQSKAAATFEPHSDA